MLHCDKYTSQDIEQFNLFDKTARDVSLILTKCQHDSVRLT